MYRALFLGIAVIAATPLLLYWYGLSLIPAEQFTTTVDLVPENASSVLWLSLGGQGDPVLAVDNPYSYILAIVSPVQKDQSLILQPQPSQGLTALASYAILPRGTKIEGGMGAWHLARAAAWIWAGRNWSPREAASAFLNAAYFGHDTVGIESAAERYFGIPVGDLSEAQLAALIVTTQSPMTYDPWCNPEANLAAVNRTFGASRFSQAGSPPGLLPVPEGVCER